MLQIYSTIWGRFCHHPFGGVKWVMPAGKTRGHGGETGLRRPRRGRWPGARRAQSSAGRGHLTAAKRRKRPVWRGREERCMRRAAARRIHRSSRPLQTGRFRRFAAVKCPLPAELWARRAPGHRPRRGRRRPVSPPCPRVFPAGITHFTPPNG